MPKASVHEDHDLRSCEHDVCFAAIRWKWREVNAVPESQRVEQAANRHLRSCVASPLPPEALSHMIRHGRRATAGRASDA